MHREVHKNTVPGAPTESVGPISLIVLARRKKNDLEEECGGQFGRRVTPKLGTHRFPKFSLALFSDKLSPWDIEDN